MNARIRLETLAARAVGSLSRAAGRGGGTTIPGKLLWKLDPSAVDALAARLPLGCRARLGDQRKDDDDRDGRADPRRGPAARVEPRGSESPLGDRIGARERGRRRARALRGRRGCAAGGGGAHAPARGGAREPLPRPARPLRRARDRRRAVARRRRGRLPEDTTLVVNADDPVVADLADGRRNVLRYGLDDPRHARPALQHAADSKYCVRCGTPYEYEAAYVGHLGAYRCPACGHARPELDVVARDIELDRPSLVPVHARRPGRRDRGRARAPGPLQRLQRDRRGEPLPRARDAARVDPRRPRGVQRGIRALRAHHSGAEDDRHPPDQESRRGERGAADARDGRAAGTRDRAERRHRGRAGRVLDLGRRLRAPPPPHPARHRDRRAGRGARATSPLRRPRERPSRGPSRHSRRRSTAGSSSPRRAASSWFSPPTRRCSRCARFSPSAASCPRTGTSRDEAARRAPLSRVPEHLRRPRQHRGSHPPRGAPRAHTRDRGARSRGRSLSRGQSTSSTSAAARTASRRRSLPISLRRARRSARRCPTARRCWPCAADTSCSGGGTSGATGRSCPASASSRTRPWRARRG